jgi:hypothetical protein
MTEIVILRLVHTLSATVRVGSAVFGSVILMPVLSGLGPAAGPVMPDIAPDIDATPTHSFIYHSLVPQENAARSLSSRAT